jgi:hypothetical protein
LLTATVGGKDVIVDSIALLMAAGPEACVSALADVLNATPFARIAPPMRDSGGGEEDVTVGNTMV